MITVGYPIDANALAKAVDLVTAAYGDAMTKAGLFKGKITEVHTYAAQILADLFAQEESPDDPPQFPRRTDAPSTSPRGFPAA